MCFVECGIAVIFVCVGLFMLLSGSSVINSNGSNILQISLSHCQTDFNVSNRSSVFFCPTKSGNGSNLVRVSLNHCQTTFDVNEGSNVVSTPSVPQRGSQSVGRRRRPRRIIRKKSFE
ncbi:uncharacterized protein LOC135834259 [Planococcus citri]|uniref:uncharacterized protein LOC135834259 n=1 Tax=Planococcus citri TaxID=170843 RepID=UPI0031FA1D6C